MTHETLIEKVEFVGEHLSLEEYRQLSLDERGELSWRLKEQNRKWLEEKFAGGQTAWLMVLDGEVIASGASLDDYPSTDQICEVGRRYGKRPFVFINDFFLLIEENFALKPSITLDFANCRTTLAVPEQT